MSESYIIPATNLSRLQEEIVKMNRKATKLGCRPVILNIGEKIIRKQHDDALDFDYESVSYVCSIDGETPMLSGWSLVSILEPVQNGEMMVREIPGQVCPPQFRISDLHCDHCGHKRRRNAVFVLKNGDDYKQVGRQCLGDFLGGVSPEGLINNAQFILNFCNLCHDSEGEGWGGMGRGPASAPLNHFVSVVSIIIRKLGWRSKADSVDCDLAPTANIAWDVCMHTKDHQVQKLIRESGLVAEPRDIELANAAIEWGKKITPEIATNSYLHDLGVCCRQETVLYKTSGYVASLINAYQRTCAEKLPIPKKVGGYVGEINQRQVFENLTIAIITPYMSGIYQKTFVKFVDANGNVLIWRASGQPDWLVLGETLSVNGTVTDNGHKLYNGQPQTEITRVKPLMVTSET